MGASSSASPMEKKQKKRSEDDEDGRHGADLGRDCKKPRREEEEAIGVNEDYKTYSHVAAGDINYRIFGIDFPAKRSNEAFLNQDFQSTGQMDSLEKGKRLQDESMDSALLKDVDQDSKAGRTSKQQQKRSKDDEDGRRADHAPDFKKPRREEEEAIGVNEDSKTSSNVAAGAISYRVFGVDLAAKRPNEAFFNQDFQSTGQMEYSLEKGTKYEAQSMEDSTAGLSKSRYGRPLIKKYSHNYMLDEKNDKLISREKKSYYCDTCNREFGSKQYYAVHFKYSTAHAQKGHNLEKPTTNVAAGQVISSIEDRGHFPSKRSSMVSDVRHEQVEEHKGEEKDENAANAATTLMLMKQGALQATRDTDHNDLPGHDPNQVAPLSVRPSEEARKATPTTRKDLELDLNEEPGLEDGGGTTTCLKNN